MFLLETSLTSNVKNTKFVRISKVFKPPFTFIRILRRKRLSRPIPHYHNSISPRRIILSRDIELNPGHKNPKKYPKVKAQRKSNYNKGNLWTCSKCYFRELLFTSLRDIEDINENTDLYYQQCTMSIFTHKNSEYHKHLSITHLNTQSMSSPFDKFQIMINENCFDIVIYFIRNMTMR